MQLTFQCPACTEGVRLETPATVQSLVCPHCDWTRPVPASDIREGRPVRCLVCGCGDLWKQKDFPQRVGVAMVALGALLSTIAWYYVWPLTAIGILMGFALIDILLYWLMSDVLVCYRCQAQYRQADLADDDRVFNLETAERYRQESMRLEQSKQPSA